MIFSADEPLHICWMTLAQAEIHRTRVTRKAMTTCSHMRANSVMPYSSMRTTVSGRTREPSPLLSTLNMITDLIAHGFYSLYCSLIFLTQYLSHRIHPYFLHICSAGCVIYIKVVTEKT